MRRYLELFAVPLACWLVTTVAEELPDLRYECDGPAPPAVKLALSDTAGAAVDAVSACLRNRDTAWYSILDSEWARVRDALEAWLDPENFDAEGRQLSSLHVTKAES